MTILLLVPSLADRGGTQKMVSELGKLLSASHRVIECSFDPSGTRPTFPNDNEVVWLGTDRAKTRARRFAGYFMAAWRLRRLKSRLAVDVTISNLWAADFVSFLARGPGKRISVGHINIVDNDDNRLLLLWRKPVGLIYRSFDRIVAVNENLRAELVSLFKLDERTTQTITNFVPSVAREFSPPTTTLDRCRLAWCGRLSAVKNLGPFLDIFAAVRTEQPAAQLVVIGSGEQDAVLEAHALSLGLRVSREAADPAADVLFVGFDPQPARHLQNCELFVLTSLAEGFGLVLVEAMNLGLPILASDCPSGGPHSVMGEPPPYTQGRRTSHETPYGYLLPVPESGDAEAATIWKQAIVSLLRAPERRRDMSRACIQRAKAFSPESVRQRWLSLLESI